jgi:undecaprenyl-diphosphatase
MKTAQDVQERPHGARSAVLASRPTARVRYGAPLAIARPLPQTAPAAREGYWIGRAGIAGALALGTAVGVLAILLFSGAGVVSVHAMTRFDKNALAFVNGFARLSPRFDAFMSYLFDAYLLQGGVMMALFWSAWFGADDTRDARRRRQTVLSSLLAMYTALLLGLAIRAALPFRPRPLRDASIVFNLPFGFDTLGASTSFPSGHAVVFFALATGLWTISKRLGLLGSLYALLFVCLPRMYLGLHYPSDIVAGAAVAVATTVAVNRMLLGSAFIEPFWAWSERHPALFNSFFFIASLDTAMEFSNAKALIRLATTQLV